MERLEFVLQVQEEERRNENFSRSCLFCRQEYNSGSELLSHMAFDHNFNIGQADNIVFINEFLDKIDPSLLSSSGSQNGNSCSFFLSETRCASGVWGRVNYFPATILSGYPLNPYPVLLWLLEMTTN